MRQGPFFAHRVGAGPGKRRAGADHSLCPSHAPIGVMPIHPERLPGGLCRLDQCQCPNFSVAL